VLHTDVSRLPRSRRAWSSWNYRVPVDEQDRVTVTYNMNMLQGLTSQQTYCVTLNDTDGIDPRRILREFVYHHPRYTRDFVAAQRRRSEIDGVRHTHYCGAGWGYGFHEDGVVSALQVARRFGEEL
jgi:predicted NAD/FAD-binding protein